jgi:hypothetical protein
LGEISRKDSLLKIKIGLKEDEIETTKRNKIWLKCFKTSWIKKLNLYSFSVTFFGCTRGSFKLNMMRPMKGSNAMISVLLYIQGGYSIYGNGNECSRKRKRAQ